jgi:CheY-like chemotaxis protein
LIEDNPDDERLALLGLRRANSAHPVIVARDGEQAIGRISSSSPAEFKLVLLDLKLPKVSGHEVLAHIHDTYRDTCPPVVVFTSSDEPIDISRSEHLGATSFVTKPVDFESYLKTMKAIADQWLR